MDKYKRLQKVEWDSIKSIKKYFFDVVDNKMFENRKFANKYKEDCLTYLADNFSQIPPSLFFVFKNVAQRYFEKIREEEGE